MEKLYLGSEGQGSLPMIWRKLILMQYPLRRQEIHELENKAGEEMKILSDFELLEDMSIWLLNPGHNRGGKNNI